MPIQEMQEIHVQSLGQEDPLEEGMAAPSNFCLEDPMDRKAWQAKVHRVTKSWTGVKQLNRHALFNEMII